MHPITELNLIQAKQNQLAKKGITTVEELAAYYPRKYKNFSDVTNIKDLTEGEEAVVFGQVMDKNLKNSPARVTIKDSNGYYMTVSWFGTDWIARNLQVGDFYYFGGKIKAFRDEFQITNPEFVTKDKKMLRIQPVYRKIKGMSEDFLQQAIQKAISYSDAYYKISEKDSFAKKLGLMPYKEMRSSIHNPETEEDLDDAKERLAFEDIYSFYEELAEKQERKTAENLVPYTEIESTRQFVRNLPFRLTKYQMQALADIINRMKAGERVDSIVSGDVGCGKTVVAATVAYLSAENGYQSVVVAPTKVLALQHLKTFSDLKLEPHRIAFISGQTKAKEKREIYEGLKDGNIDILIGTHACLSDDIEFKNLGLCIVDEEQKFGTAQKEILEQRRDIHFLSMTATPIPRSISKVLYTNEGSVIRIEGRPKGRLPIKTEYSDNAWDAFYKIAEEVKMGHKAYIVCPFIEDSENDSFKDVFSVASAKEEFEEFLNEEGLDIPYAVISGSMAAATIDKEVSRFSEGDAMVLFSTSIVEVGVNVPSASVMIILNAERFGLSSMHQLRGRVGRSDIQSYCVLVSENVTRRIRIMLDTLDGFKIATEDIALRGPGDVLGLDQTGVNKTIGNILDYPELAEKTKKYFFN